MSRRKLSPKDFKALQRAREGRGALSLTFLHLQDCQRSPSHPGDRGGSANLALG
jgi:hypothetical protein